MYDILKNIIIESWQVLGQMSPYLLFGFLVAGILSVCISPELVERHLGNGGIWPLLKASLFAVFRPVVASVTGIIGGGLVDVLDRNTENENRNQQKCSDQCCADGGKNNHKIIRALKCGFVTLPRDIGKAMLAGLVIAAVISALVPDGYFAEKLGTGIFAMVVMM